MVPPPPAGPELEVVRADPAMLPFILETERLPGFEDVVGRWSEQRHRAALADRQTAYFVGRRAGEPIGFAILLGWASPDRATLLKRIAVDRPGHGLGRALLAGVVDRVFRDTDAHRLWLGVFPDNLRARRCYQAVGFRAEGVARESAYFGGVYRDELIMSLLRTEWSARGASAPGGLHR
jgi:RimJ/RimL family protein N-acetyltransferase